MQSHPQQRRIILARQVGVALRIALEITVTVNQRLSVTVDGKAEKITPINVIAQVLEDCQLRFHEGGVIAVVLVAHQAVFQFAMTHVVIVKGAIITQHSYRNTGQRARQHLLNMLAGEVAFILAHVKTLRIRGVIAIIAQNNLAGMRGITVIVAQMSIPLRQWKISVESRCAFAILIGDQPANAQSMRQFMQRNTVQVSVAGARYLCGQIVFVIEIQLSKRKLPMRAKG